MSKYFFKDLTTEERFSVRLKIATRKYDVFDGYIIVSINLGERKDVQISEEDMSEFCAGEFSAWEPIYKNLEAQLQNVTNGHFIKTLEQYKCNGGKSGSQLKDKLYIKYYHLEQPANVERDEVGRKWIDYNAQLSLKNCIYDSEDGCGIWVTNSDFLYRSMEAVDRYGENIMVLSPIDDLEYVVTDNEIVGDGFEVKFYGSLNREDTWYSLWKLLGDKIIEDMPLDIIRRFNGAKVIHDKYITNKENMWMKERNRKGGVLMKKWFCNLSWYSKVLIILAIILTVVNIVLIVAGKSIVESLQGSTSVIFEQASQAVSDFTDEYPTQSSSEMESLISSLKDNTFKIIEIVVALFLLVVGGFICSYFIDPIKEFVISLWETASKIGASIPDGWVPILAGIYDFINIIFLLKTITDIVSVIH